MWQVSFEEPPLPDDCINFYGVADEGGEVIKEKDLGVVVSKLFYGKTAPGSVAKKDDCTVTLGRFDDLQGNVARFLSRNPQYAYFSAVQLKWCKLEQRTMALLFRSLTAALQDERFFLSKLHLSNSDVSTLSMFSRLLEYDWSGDAKVSVDFSPGNLKFRFNKIVPERLAARLLILQNARNEPKKRNRRCIAISSGCPVKGSSVEEHLAFSGVYFSPRKRRIMISRYFGDKAKLNFWLKLKLVKIIH